MLPDGHSVEREPTLVKHVCKGLFSPDASKSFVQPRNCCVFQFLSLLLFFSFSPVSHTPSVLNLLQLITLLFLPSYVVTSEDVICLQGVEQKAEEISRLEEMNLTSQ